MPDTAELVSYCPTCDAPPDECNHTGPRYLDPITYEKIESGGWKVPDHERDRWDNERIGQATPATATPPPEPKPLTQILTELEPYMHLSDVIRTTITDAYAVNPHQTWQLAENIKRRATHLENPGGVLISGARKIVSYE